MTDNLRCSGYIEGQKCKHGFRTSIACWPVSIEQARRCAPPMCCDEERCAELFEDGKPQQPDMQTVRKPE